VDGWGRRPARANRGAPGGRGPHGQVRWDEAPAESAGAAAGSWARAAQPAAGPWPRDFERGTGAGGRRDGRTGRRRAWTRCRKTSSRGRLRRGSVRLRGPERAVGGRCVMGGVSAGAWGRREMPAGRMPAQGSRARRGRRAGFRSRNSGRELPGLRDDGTGCPGERGQGPSARAAGHPLASDGALLTPACPTRGGGLPGGRLSSSLWPFHQRPGTSGSSVCSARLACIRPRAGRSRQGWQPAPER